MRTATHLHSSSLSLPPDSYIYRIIPISDGLTFASISSDDSLRLFNANTLQLTHGEPFTKAHDGVTCLERLSTNPNCILTAGRDAAVRCWDSRSRGTTFELNDLRHSSCLSMKSCNTDIVTGTELTHSHAAVSIWDCRFTNAPRQQYVESHSDDVTEICFYPDNPAYLLSGSVDGLVNVYDTKVTDEDEALIQITNHGSSINHAGFLSNGEIFALSHDESFSIYPFSNPSRPDSNSNPAEFGDLRSALSCEYIVDVGLYGTAAAILSAGSHSKEYLDLVPLIPVPQWSFSTDLAIRLRSAHGSNVIRSVYIQNQRVFTAGEDGLVQAWQMPPPETEDESDEEAITKLANVDDDDDDEMQPYKQKGTGRKRKKIDDEGTESVRLRNRPY